MDPYLLSWILICILFSALFSGLEIAFIATNKLHIELQRQQGNVSGRILSKFLNKPSRFIATTLIGNNLALVFYGVLMAQALKPLVYDALPATFQNDVLVLLIQTIISTLIVLMTAEFIPKSIFLINPYFLLSIFSLPFLLIYYALFPVMWIIVNVSKFFISKVLRLEYSEDKPVFGLTDLNQYIKNIISTEKEETKKDVDTKIFNNALEFKTIRVRECMIPRTEISAVDVNDNMDDLKTEFIESGHSKIIVYNESIDDVIGYCHSLELLKKPADIKSILTKIPIVPETMAANELLIQLITEHKSLALVVDEYGGTSGIVSMEDIIEEIFGEIRDEHDDEEFTEQKIDDHTYKLSARLEIDYLNDKYGWKLPEGEFDTLGGMILAINENLPEMGERIEHQGLCFEILSMDDTRIENIKLEFKVATTDQ